MARTLRWVAVVTRDAGDLGGSDVERIPGVSRWFQERREPALAELLVRVIAASPYPDEPDDVNYRPSLLVQVEPGPDGRARDVSALVYSTLLFVDWARRSLRDPALALRFEALLPRLRLAVKLGKLGPAALDAHRRGQQERYYHHREAAVYHVELRDGRKGLDVTVKSEPKRGAWTPAATLLQAATVAPFEALQRLEHRDQVTLLAWLEHAVERWCDERDAAFPRDHWQVGGPVEAPAGE